MTERNKIVNIRDTRGAIAQLGERLRGTQEVGGSIPPSSNVSPSSRGLGHRPFTAVTGVRIPLGTPAFFEKKMVLSEYTLHHVDGLPIDWSCFDNKTLLFCNIARFCGLTIQMQELARLQSKFPDSLTIIASPCNQFLFQEPGSSSTICSIYEQTPFLITEKIKVNGPNTHPLYRELKQCATTSKFWPHPLSLLSKHIIFWNFTKFIVSPDRRKILRFAPQTSPISLQNIISQLSTSSP